MSAMNERDDRWTRGWIVRSIWSIWLAMVAGAYLYGVGRSLFGGGSLPSALWLTDPVRREAFVGWSVAVLVVALAAFLIAWFAWPRTKTT